MCFIGRVCFSLATCQDVIFVKELFFFKFSHSFHINVNFIDGTEDRRKAQIEIKEIFIVHKNHAENFSDVIGAPQLNYG